MRWLKSVWDVWMLFIVVGVLGLLRHLRQFNFTGACCCSQTPFGFSATSGSSAGGFGWWRGAFAAPRLRRLWGGPDPTSCQTLQAGPPLSAIQWLSSSVSGIADWGVVRLWVSLFAHVFYVPMKPAKIWGILVWDKLIVILIFGNPKPTDPSYVDCWMQIS